MKLSTFLPTTTNLLFLAPTLVQACLQISGVVDDNGSVFTVSTTDNGLVTCDAFNMGWRIDQDGHFSANCLPGYVYATTLDGSFAWYANPVEAFSFTQSTASTGVSGVYRINQNEFSC
ncbi:hypothetical protein BDZ45DRAFT_674896 [Acephala macrosclerotiorum]|nr:hypothetical protein BDZ45DRAFT_674896 [Acephala macrosclerotiorum]